MYKGTDTQLEGKKCLKYCQKFFHVVIFSILFVCLLYAGYHCARQFIEKPTYTATRIQQQHDAKFPALSICPKTKGYKDEMLKEHGISDPNCYYDVHNCKLGRPDWTGNDSNVSPRELFNKSTMEINEVVNYIFVRFLYAHEKFNNSKTLKNRDLMTLKRSHHRKYGYCFTYYPDESYRNAGIYYMKISVKMPVRIHLHEENQFLAFNGRLAHTVMLGERNDISLNIHDIDQIQRMSDQDDHTDHLPDTTFRHEYTCSLEPYDTCMYDRMSKEMISQTKDNCTVPWYPPHGLSNGTICSSEDDINIAYNIHYSRISNARKDCNEPCRMLVLNQAGKNYQGKNETWDHGLIYFYFSATSFQSIEHFLYPIETLVAEFGGYMGLLLGVSILDIAFRVVDIMG